ncbi:hypothetical protein [Lacticaseibacillus salsurivasis]|uniref:hypothetical protein n=1 Tax=Lacticaseibacillus salsurivasis TaxID=3081441 RepID=UPI0030C68BBA
MEINVKAFQTAIQEENFEQINHSVTPQQAQADLTGALAPVFADLEAAINAGKLIQAQLTITSETPTYVRLETGVINLPFADSKKVSNFLDPDSMAPLKIYLIVATPDLNASDLHIDLVADAETYLAHPKANQAAVIAEVSEDLVRIKANHDAPKPVVKAAPANRAKTTARKSTTRKVTTRKTTKKSSTRKAATKRTPAAKKGE